MVVADETFGLVDLERPQVKQECTTVEDCSGAMRGVSLYKGEECMRRYSIIDHILGYVFVKMSNGVKCLFSRKTYHLSR